MSHDDDTCPHLVVLGRLEAENARLKAEVERLTKALDDSMISCFSAELEAKCLAPKVEELTLENSQYEEHHKYGQNVITSLREDVENSKRINTELLVLSNRQASDIKRLTKAGDAIVSFLWMENDDDNCNGAITYIAEKAERDWNAAKEGKQP